MPGIFVSYRRKGAKTSTFRLVGDLQREFGDERIFLDVESIDPGVPFADAIHGAIEKSSVVLVVVGPKWLKLEDSKGERLLDKPDDWVRRELEIALESGAPVIQVLVEEAEAPDAHALPESIRRLAGLQAFALVDDKVHWDFDVKRLIEKIRRIAPELPPRPSPGSIPEDGPTPQHGVKKPSGFNIKGVVAAVLIALGGAVWLAGGLDEEPEGEFSATAYCGITNVTGMAFDHPTLEQAIEVAIQDCIDQGGVPDCCRSGVSW